MTDTEYIDPEELECADSADWDAVRRGKEYSEKDVEWYFCIRNFINVAYSNIISAVVAILDDKLPKEIALNLAYIPGREDDEDNHSATMEQFWSLGIEFRGKRKAIWFPCKLFWKKRKEISEWFNNDGSIQIAKLVSWIKEKNDEIEDSVQTKCLKTIAEIVDRGIVKPENGHYPSGPVGTVSLGLEEVARLSEALNEGLYRKPVTNDVVVSIKEMLNKIDEFTNLLDIPENGKLPILCPSHSYIAVKIRRLVRDIKKKLIPGD